MSNSPSDPPIYGDSDCTALSSMPSTERDPQKRQDGSYWVRWWKFDCGETKPSAKWTIAEWDSANQEWSHHRGSPAEVGQRIPSPDEAAPSERPNVDPKDLTWICRFHPTNWFHEIGCPHVVWTKEQLQSAIESGKRKWPELAERWRTDAERLVAERVVALEAENAKLREVLRKALSDEPWVDAAKRVMYPDAAREGTEE